MKKSLMFALSTLSTAMMLVSCADVQDGDGIDRRSNINGLVVDGRIANGLVWIDLNQNGRLDKDFEPYARTDADGYYSFNPVSGVDYCQRGNLSLEEFEDNLRHCLIFGASYDPILLRVRGGIDLDTGERLKGSMSMETTISQASVLRQEPMVMSPLTSLLRHGEAEQGSLLEALGITVEELFLDFTELAENFDTLTPDEQEAELQKRAMYADAATIQTIQHTLSEGTGADSVQDQDALMRELAKILLAKPDESSQAVGSSTTNGTSALVDLLSNTNQLQTVFTYALPEDKRDAQRLERLAQRSTQITTVLQEIRNSNTNPRATIQTVEIISDLVIREAKGRDSAAVQQLLGANSNDATQLTALVTQLRDAITVATTNDGSGTGKPSLDLNNLARELVGAAQHGAPDLTTVVTGSKLQARNWQGWLVLEATDDDADQVTEGSYIAFYLSSQGRVGACIDVDLTEDDVSDEFNTKNEFVGGTWSQLNSSTVVLNLSYRGISYEGQMRNLTPVQTAAGEQQRVRFSSDLVDERRALVINSTRSAELEGTPRPSNNSDCEALFGSI